MPFVRGVASSRPSKSLKGFGFLLFLMLSGVCACVGGGGKAYSFAACPSHLTLDHASLSRRSTVPTPNRDTFNIWALITLFPCTTWKLCWLILSSSWGREGGVMRGAGGKLEASRGGGLPPLQRGLASSPTPSTSLKSRRSNPAACFLRR